MRAPFIVGVTLLGALLAYPAFAAGSDAAAQADGWDFSHRAPTPKDAADEKATAVPKHEASAAQPADTATLVKSAPAAHMGTPSASHGAMSSVSHSPAPTAHAAGAGNPTPSGVRLVWGDSPTTSHGGASVVSPGGVVLEWSPGSASHGSPAAAEPTAVTTVKEHEAIALEPTMAEAASTAAPAAEPAAVPAPVAEATDAPAGADVRAASSEVELLPGRPGFTESRGVVSAGVVQLEAGYAFAADETDGLVSHTSSVPGLVVRLGLGGPAEFRIVGAGLTSQTQTSALGRSQSVGFGDVQIGMKIMALHEREAGVELGVIPMLSIPSRVNAVSSFGYDPSLTISFGRALPKGFDATGLVRGAWLTAGGARATQYSGSVSVGHAMWNGWGGSAEVFTLSDPVTGALQWNLGTAVARQIGRRLQVDVDLGHSLNYLAPAWTFGAGFVVR